ncbi:MAG: glycosyltransferase [Candidatus Promineifilaceae bacterium]|nr:glycosyltransferase [Candidatus Promineifilaceae bacterium]
MKIFINTFGSRGDVQPYVALGQGLAAQGHEVTVCTASTFESFITENGLNYGYMTAELLQLIDTDIGRTAVEETVGVLGAAKSMIKLTKMAMPLNRQMILDSWAAAQEVEPDLIIYHPKALGAVSIAEAFAVPAIMAILMPMMAPTTEFPPIGMPQLKLGGRYIKLSYKLITLGYRPYIKTVNEIRREHMGLNDFPRSTGITTFADGRPIPIMHGFSPHVIPTPADWPDTTITTGYWFLQNNQNWQPSPELQAFLDAGEPPVYVGFGSMAGKNPERLASIVIQALTKAAKRGIIATGWGGLQANDFSDNIFKIDKAPHDWLFPRMSAVIHHGGAGTTAAGLRAGRPTLICSFMGDQPFWGKRVHDLGVGPPSIPQKKLTVAKLIAALQLMTEDRKMVRRAAELGAQIRAEDGVQTAVQFSNSIAARQPVKTAPARR